MPRAAPAYVGVRTLSKKFTAKCEANQHLVDKLAEKREKAGSSNFAYTLKRAAESICQEKTPITKFEEAIALKGVGPSIATSLGFSKSFGNKDSGSVSSSHKGRGKKAPPNGATNGVGSAPDSPSSIKSASSSVSGRALKRKAPTENKIMSVLPVIKEQPSRKESAYQKAVQEADSWKGMDLKWRLVLLIDQRERKAEHYSSKVQQCGIPTEIRSLPIGDMCWIAQGFTDNDETKLIAELMLGTIIERKEVADLKSSLFGTRYHEQQLRLKESGQPQVIFLVEGDTKKDLYRCPAETLHSTMWAIRIEKQNQVIQTAHTEETVQTLRRMHRRMLQRTFPSAFYSEALPAFSGPDAARSRGRRQRDSFGEQHRKRRRRLESLHGLVFDEDPVPMAGMARFVSYQELRAKVERDREAGRRTVGSIHQGMLKQVATISDTKIIPISNKYPTANALLMAYDNVPSQADRKRLHENLDISGNIATVGRKTLGPRSSEELYIAYGLDVNRRDSIESNASASSCQAQNAEEVAKIMDLQRFPLAASKTYGTQMASEPSTNPVSLSSIPPRVLSTKEASARHQHVSINANKPPPAQKFGTTKESSKSYLENTVELLSSDEDIGNTSTSPLPAKRRCSSLSSDGSLDFGKSLGGVSSGKALCGGRTAPKSAAAFSTSFDSSDEELEQMLNDLSKKKSALKKSKEVIEID